ncbi:hypothetical protein OS493_003573 [Desmophyllum pertusum]|uniref:Uncharacterized protein n=1 Tax=Desmophyllum pertusum TaxID=174260 RepID=A0A9X0A6W3_9CNID|nr:hypothetical protein OS493_003573 [Desmophyllum pertusum]
MASFTSLNRNNVKFRIFFAILTVTVKLPKARSLRCNICESTQSWETCNANMTTIECPTVTDATCVKYSYEMTDTNSDKQQRMFARGCLPQYQCSSSLLPACADLEKSGSKIKATCHVSCCGEDLCNSQAKYNSSVLFLMAMFFVHVFVKCLL